jgi:protease IV
MAKKVLWQDNFKEKVMTMTWSRKKKAWMFIIVFVVCVFCLVLISGRLGKPSGDRIGVIEIEGMISASKETMENIIDFREDPTIKAVILRINSPGGAVGPTQEIFREVDKLKKVKKVYVSMGTTCASGGYYIASAADKLYANPSSITGSIGVIMQLMIFDDVLKKIGVKSNTIKAGEFKDAGTPFRKMTASEKAYMEGVVQNIYGQFVEDIASGRKMNVEIVKKIAEGRIYTGNQALKLNLIDGIGNFYDTVDALKDAVHMKGKPILVYTEKPFSFSGWLFGSLSQDFTKELSNRIFSSPFSFIIAH